MEYKQKQASETVTRPSPVASNRARSLSSDQQFTHLNPTSNFYGVGAQQPFTEFAPALEPGPQHLYPTDHDQSNSDMKQGNHLSSTPVDNTGLGCDPRAMLNNLSFLEQKIHQVQDIVRSIMNREGHLSLRPNELAAQQQLVTADLTSIIIQLISTAGTLLPSINGTLLSTNSPVAQLGNIIGSPTGLVGLNGNLEQSEDFISEGTKGSEFEEQVQGMANYVSDVPDATPVEDQDGKDFEDGVEGENLPPGSYEVLQLEKEEILAPHTHFCSICGKGFKRDANLRMHMRGHGDEYKTPAALAKPSKDQNSEPVLIKRYSCPFVGCKRNKEHRKFQPLKTILCVKNHYKRSHCAKRYTCSRCNSKKFSVIADLKTHEKHCGRDKWICSCGTTFSRKDKLFGHVSLFQGHTPSLPLEETKGSGTSDQGQCNEATSSTANMGFNFGGSSGDDVDALDVKVLDCVFSPMNFDTYNFGGLNEFPRPAFEVSESSFSFLPSMSSNYVRKCGENSNFS
uniref:Zinc finger protein STOP1 n=1 Tax=Anthurium amnicola TaxID=1678845 RepID=A0A1D1XYN4_9ARAE